MRGAAGSDWHAGPMPPAAPRTGPESQAPDEESPTGGFAAPGSRWWWTGAYRGVLGALVVGFQAPEIMSGEAHVMNWLVGALGAAAAVWGVVLVAQAYRARPADQG